MKKVLIFFVTFALAAGCFAGCGKKAEIIEVELSNEKQLNYSEEKQDKSTNSVMNNKSEYDNTASAGLKISSETTNNSIIRVSDPTNPQTSRLEPTLGKRIIEGTKVDAFIITKISGDYLELNRVIGNDVEKLVYSCSLGNFEGFADMNFKVGDKITLRYDSEIAETYPLQLTVKEIL